MNLKDILSTLITNGFHISNVVRVTPTNTIVSIYKYDKLGAQVKYSILFTEDSHKSQAIEQLLTISKSYLSKPLLVSDSIKTDKCDNYGIKNFFDFFGGIIDTGLILISNLVEILNDLGHNKLPNGLAGKPDDLLELYVKECLQFIMMSPARRYGSDRLFESLPDGIVICKDGFMTLHDAKAYENGFNFSADDIKRFAGYVNDFNTRYGVYFGNIFAFIVITGHFNDSEASISNRSDELYKLCNCKLTCIEASELGEIVILLKNDQQYRGSIAWKNILSKIMIKKEHILSEIDRILKDKVH